MTFVLPWTEQMPQSSFLVNLYREGMQNDSNKPEMLLREGESQLDKNLLGGALFNKISTREHL